MELIILGLFILAANYLGYRMGKGDVIDLIPKSFKPIIRTDEEEAEMIKNIKEKRNRVGVLHG